MDSQIENQRSNFFGESDFILGNRKVITSDPRVLPTNSFSSADSNLKSKRLSHTARKLLRYAVRRSTRKVYKAKLCKYSIRRVDHNVDLYSGSLFKLQIF